MSFSESRFINVEQSGPIVIRADVSALATHPTIANTMAEAASVDGDTHLPDLQNEGPLRNPFHLDRSDQGGWFLMTLAVIANGGSGPDFYLTESDADGTPPSGAESIAAHNLLGDHTIADDTLALMLEDHAGSKVFVPLTACGFLGDYSDTMFANDNANRDCITQLQGAVNTRFGALETDVAYALEENCGCVNEQLAIFEVAFNHNMGCLDTILGAPWIGCRTLIDPELIGCDCVTLDPADPIALSCDDLVDPCEEA
jgi:hypothetical protein